MDTSAIDFNFNDWSITPKERTRDRMKLQVKLSKIEAQAFKNFMDTVKPTEVSEDDFMKAIFRVGMEEMERKLVEAAQEYVEEHREELAASGVDLSELEAASDAVEVIE
jgi:Zn-dependent M16 (insulinase) family peptidase